MDLPDLDTANAVLRAAQGENVAAKAERSVARARDGRGDKAHLERAAKQFEAMFYNQLLKTMRATVPENGFWGGGSGTKIYQQMHDQELAGRMAEHGGLGIADLIVDQFATAAERESGRPASPPVQPAVQRRGLATYGLRKEADVVRLRRLASGLGGAPADTLGRFERELVAAARESGLDPGLVLAVTVKESAGDPTAESHRGAQGLMQLMPATAREVGVANPLDPAQNLRGGARYLSRMIARYDGDLDLALAAYNAGPGNVDRAGRSIPPFPETVRYVEAVKGLATKLGARTGTNLVSGDGTSPDPEPNARWPR